MSTIIGLLDVSSWTPEEMGAARYAAEKNGVIIKGDQSHMSFELPTHGLEFFKDMAQKLNEKTELGARRKEIE